MNFKIFLPFEFCRLPFAVCNLRFAFCLVLFALCLLTFSSCSTTETQSSKKQIAFFDTDAFLKNEQVRLRAAPHKIAAKVSVNGKVEEKQLDSLNYDDAFALFFQSSINKTAWKEKYIIDSVLSEGGLKKLVYTARNENLKTRRLEIDFNAQKTPEHLVFDFVNKSILGEVIQKLEYNPSVGMKIYNKQEILLIPNSEMIMEYKFGL